VETAGAEGLSASYMTISFADAAVASAAYMTADSVFAFISVSVVCVEWMDNVLL
jgi:hypothetical protein